MKKHNIIRINMNAPTLSATQNDKVPTVGVLIRFANSAETLPAVLKALRLQSLQPDVILGVNNQSSDGSDVLFESAGGWIVEWDQAYEHSKVLNFGMGHLATDLVLILSSHTVLEDPDTIAKMVEAMRDPRTACVSGKWDKDAYYSDCIDWHELATKGLKLGSIYSNSMGMIRRSLWLEESFAEDIETAEDYVWAVSQVERGYLCRRLDFAFNYRRSGVSRVGHFAEATFNLAHRYHLRVAWLGVRHTLREILRGILVQSDALPLHLARLRGWILSQRSHA